MVIPPTKENNIIRVKDLPRLKQTLVSYGLVTEEQLELAEITAQRENENLSNILVRLGFVTEEQLLKCIAEMIRVPYVNMGNYTIDRNVFARIPDKIVRRYKIIPLFMIEGVLTVATSDPLDLVSMDDIAKVARCKIEPVIASKASIDRYFEENNPAEWQEQDFELSEKEFELEVHGEDVKGNRFTDRSVCEAVNGEELKFVARQPDKYFQGQILEISIYLPGPADVRACMKGKGQVLFVKWSGDFLIVSGKKRVNITVKLCSSLLFEKIVYEKDNK